MEQLGLLDARGRERLRLVVTAEGDARIKFLNEQGRLIAYAASSEVDAKRWRRLTTEWSRRANRAVRSCRPRRAAHSEL